MMASYQGLKTTEKPPISGIRHGQGGWLSNLIYGALCKPGSGRPVHGSGQRPSARRPGCTARRPQRSQSPLQPPTLSVIGCRGRSDHRHAAGTPSSPPYRWRSARANSRPAALWRPRSQGIAMLTHRNPTRLLGVPVLLNIRNEKRRSEGELLHAPPRTTFPRPPSGPRGSTRGDRA